MLSPCHAPVTIRLHVGQYLLHQELVRGVGDAGAMGAVGAVCGMGATGSVGGVGAAGDAGAMGATGAPGAAGGTARHMAYNFLSLFYAQYFVTGNTMILLQVVSTDPQKIY